MENEQKETLKNLKPEEIARIQEMMKKIIVANLTEEEKAKMEKALLSYLDKTAEIMRDKKSGKIKHWYILELLTFAFIEGFDEGYYAE